MYTRTAGVALALALAAAAVPAFADTSKSVTATGTATVRVKPANRHSNASIRAAVHAAQLAGVKGAIADSKEYAEQYASAAGMTLGSIVGVSDVVSRAYPFGPFYVNGGPFGPNQYCGTLHIPVIKRLKHHRIKVVRFRKVHRCVVPFSETTTLAVTYSAT
jgi:hypothetical protein